MLIAKLYLRNMRHLFKIVFLFLIYLTRVKCADILLISNCLSHSHSMWYNKLATLLADSGHQVVLLDTDPLKSKNGNITHFLIEDAYDFSSMHMTPEFMEDFSVMAEQSTFANVESYFSYLKSCRKLINSKGVKNLMNIYRDKKFDLIIFDYFCDSFFGLVPYFGNPPFMVATAFADPENVLESIGYFDNPSFVPARIFSSLHVKMNFVERATNLFYYLHFFYRFNTDYLPFEEESAKQVFGADTQSVLEIRRNVSLIMVNTHFTIFGAKPLPPAVVPVAGFHIEPTKPLPKDIQKFIDGAKYGAILFSFGSNLPSEMITRQKVKMYLDVFSNLPQRVIWKFNESLIEKLPSNVLVKNWLPQQDILAHESTALFISHGGLLGSQEAMYFGVPIIGIPFGIDQVSNIERIVSKGLGLKLSFKHVTAVALKEAITIITTDKSYKERMRKLSSVLRDSPMKPKEVVRYWLEYVLRNRDNLDYIRSQSANLAPFQLFLLDIVSTFLIAILVVIFLTKFIVNQLIRIAFSKPKKPSTVKYSTYVFTFSLKPKQH